MQMKLSEILEPNEELFGVFMYAEDYAHLEDGELRRSFYPVPWGGAYEGGWYAGYRSLERYTSAARWLPHNFLNDKTDQSLCLAYLLIDRTQPEAPPVVAPKFLFDRRLN